MIKLKNKDINKTKNTKKLSYRLALITLCCVCAFSIVGCSTKAKKDDTKKDNTKNEKTDTEVDYSEYDFAGVQWNRDAECDLETLCFLTNGEFRYSCACGNSVNDSDVVDSYSYDDKTKMFTLNCCEEIDDMITEIKLISCDGKNLELDFGGEKRAFYVEEDK